MKNQLMKMQFLLVRTYELTLKLIYLHKLNLNGPYIEFKSFIGFIVIYTHFISLIDSVFLFGM